MDTNPIPSQLKAFVTLGARHVRTSDTVTVTVAFEGATVAHQAIVYGPKYGVAAWDATLGSLGYQRTTPWRGDDAGLWANVEKVATTNG